MHSLAPLLRRILPSALCLFALQGCLARGANESPADRSEFLATEEATLSQVILQPETCLEQGATKPNESVRLRLWSATGTSRELREEEKLLNSMLASAVETLASSENPIEAKDDLSPSNQRILSFAVTDISPNRTLDRAFRRLNKGMRANTRFLVITGLVKCNLDDARAYFYPTRIPATALPSTWDETATQQIIQGMKRVLTTEQEARNTSSVASTSTG